MKAVSAGILMYRKRNDRLEVFLVHPGGPFWARKDDGAWSIPKGEVEEGEDKIEAAKREFREETGYQPPLDSARGYQPLGEAKLKSGKIIRAWAVEGDLDEKSIESVEFELEWPPKSGQMKKFPEADRAGWFSLETARKKIHPGQTPFIDAIARL